MGARLLGRRSPGTVLGKNNLKSRSGAADPLPVRGNATRDKESERRPRALGLCSTSSSSGTPDLVARLAGIPSQMTV